MDWLLEHPQILIIIAGAIAYMVKHHGAAAEEEGDETRKTPQQPSRGAMARENQRSEEAERARRIREDMVRRREARTGTPATAPMAAPPTPSVAQPPPMVVPPRPWDAPPPVFRDPMAEMMKEIAKRFQPDPEPDMPRASVPAEDETRQARVRGLEARISMLEQEKADAVARAKRLEAGLPVTSETSSVWIADDLRDVAGLRRAIVLNEILGRPVGLR